MPVGRRIGLEHSICRAVSRHPIGTLLTIYISKSTFHFAMNLTDY